MNVTLRWLRLPALVCSLVTLGLLPWAHAREPDQTVFPHKAITLVVPYEVGGTTDLLGRMLANRLSAGLGQAVEVENRPGNGTVVAAEWTAGAAPDGYTLMLASISTLVLNPVLRSNLGYDPVNSFTQLGMFAEMQLLMLASPRGPASMAELTSLAQARPHTVTYGSDGLGSSAYFTGEMFKSMTGTAMEHVAFSGSNSNIRALLDGKTTTALDTVVAALPLISQGKLQALASFAPERLNLLPDVPTMIELGYPELALSTWYAVIAPKNLGEPVRRRLEAALQEVATSRPFRGSITAMGLNPMWGDGDSVVRRIRHEIPRMKAVVLLDGIKG